MTRGYGSDEMLPNMPDTRRTRLSRSGPGGLEPPMMDDAAASHVGDSDTSSMPLSHGPVAMDADGSDKISINSHDPVDDAMPSDFDQSEQVTSTEHVGPVDGNGEDETLASIEKVSERFAADGSSVVDSGDDDGQSSRKRRVWLWVGGAVIGVVLLVLGGLGVYYTVHPSNQRVDNTSKVGGNSIGANNGSTGVDDSKDDESAEKAFMKSIGVPDFYQEPKEEMTKEQEAAAVSYALVTEPANAVGRFMSKESNPDLTDNPSQYLLEDGSTNPNYSYLTGENTTAVIRDDMERLVNPVYGGWTFLQDDIRQDVDGYPQDISSLALGEMFVPEVAGTMSDEQGVRNATKLYADWDSNQYGGEWSGKMSTVPIIGQVIDYECDYNIVGSMDDTINCTARVRYTGSVSDANGKKVVKNVDRTLKLNYRVNYDSSISRRILLDSVEQ